jgi:DNA-binding MarR family transcriptional regulator
MMQQSLDGDLLFLLYDVARLMRVRADQHARLTGMTRAQWVLLVWLERKPGVTQNELASLVEVEPITIARLIDRLEARGVVERRHDPKDRRVRRLHLTEAAAPLLDVVHAYRRDSNKVLTEGVPPDDLKRILAGLMTMKSNLLDEKRDCAENI